MPFDKTFDDVYQIGIKEACSAAGAYCERVDEQIFHERILDRIYNQVAKADLIIADMSGRNPNVFYEVGYAHALGKATILITQHADDIPFDLKHFPHIVYEHSLTTLRDKVTQRVKWCIEHPSGSAPDRGIQIELFIGKQSLASDSIIHEISENEYPNVELTVHNASATTFGDGAFKIGIIAGSRFPGAKSKNKLLPPETIRLPNGDFLHMYSNFPVLFPDGYAHFHAILLPEEGDDLHDIVEVPLTARVYSQLGTREFKFTLKSIQ